MNHTGNKKYNFLLQFFIYANYENYTQALEW